MLKNKEILINCAEIEKSEIEKCSPLFSRCNQILKNQILDQALKFRQNDSAPIVVF